MDQDGLAVVAVVVGGGHRTDSPSGHAPFIKHLKWFVKSELQRCGQSGLLATFFGDL